MTDDERLAAGWTRQAGHCYACGHSQVIWVPPPHPPLPVPARPQAEHDAAQRANDTTRAATEDRQNRRY